MKLFLDGHDLEYEMRALCFAFFPGEPVECQNTAAGGCPDDDFVYTKIKRHADNKISALVCVSKGGVRKCAAERVRVKPNERGHEFDIQCEFALGRAMYRAVAKITGFRHPWGILTGIRPVKLARARLSAGMAPDMAAKDLQKQFYTSKEKAELCVEAGILEEQIISLSQPNSASLYISIPFCPSRCLYCSFISHDVEKMAKLLPEYVRLMCEEIEKTGELATELGLRLETIYIGGGTPTSLSARQLSDIMSCVKKSFKLDWLREYTVEAGRPDTITREKLDAIIEGGATRISINPQTLNDDILRAIGRNHTSAQVFEAFAQARQAGFKSINMDLIAGLPGDTPQGFSKTLDGVLSLDPEAITVHTLAMKRSSRLVTSGGGYYDAEARDVNLMLSEARSRFKTAGYRPYYLYRQKNTLGGLENVGFAKPGFEGLYNIFIMDETHTILAVGAGAVTKLRQPHGDKIERVFNFKYPYEYIGRFSEILDRKKKVKEFYASYN
ncbi:coproporphyrinogen dehydrogenase HemZ [[Clostridium] cellulosi]|nr:MAG: coproporphyrinogen dehydrogenase HemZ [[Clostridium] cellulosi]